MARLSLRPDPGPRARILRRPRAGDRVPRASMASTFQIWQVVSSAEAVGIADQATITSDHGDIDTLGTTASQLSSLHVTTALNRLVVDVMRTSASYLVRSFCEQAHAFVTRVSVKP